MKFLINTTFLLFFLTSITCFSQTDPQTDNGGLHTQVIPPSPTAASLEKFVSVPVGHYTGTPVISIPIWEAKGRKLSVPVSLSYHASGVRVDELPGWVGSNWALNAGGVISRSMHGKPDEINNGYLDKNYIFPTTIDSTNDLNTFLDSSHLDLMRQALNGTIDLQPDIFSFNFNGLSGKFVFGADDQIYTIPYQKLDIQRTLVAQSTQWKITTGDGITYVFGVTDSGRKAVEKSFVETDGNHQPLYESSWYLVEIITPFTNEKIELFYQPNEIEHELTQTQTNYHVPLGGTTGDGLPGEHTVNSSTYMKTYSVNLHKIETDFQTIQFNITDGREDTKNNSGCRLTNIQVFHKSDNSLMRQFDLKYSYFQTTVNTSYSNATHLKKRLRLDSLIESIDLCHQKPPYVFQYHEEVDLPSRFSYNQDHWGYANGKNNSTAVPDFFSGILPGSASSINPFLYSTFIAPRFVPGGDRTPDNSSEKYYLKAGTLKKITYPTGGTATYEYEAHDYGNRGDILEENIHDISVLAKCTNESGNCFSTNCAQCIPNDQISFTIDHQQ